MENKTKILFDENSLTFVLEALGYNVDNEGYVIYKGGSRALDVNGKEFKKVDITGIQNGKFYTNVFDYVDDFKFTEKIREYVGNIEKSLEDFKKEFNNHSYPESSSYAAHFPEMHVSLEPPKVEPVVRYVYRSPIMNSWFISKSPDEKFADLLYKAHFSYTDKPINKDERFFNVGSVVCDMDDDILEVKAIFDLQDNPIELHYFFAGFDEEYKFWLLYHDLTPNNLFSISRLLTTVKDDDDNIEVFGSNEPKVGNIVSTLEKNYRVISSEILTENNIRDFLNKKENE